MKAIIYTRVSTGKQRDNGVSLEAQESAAREHCDKNGLEIIGFYSESMSASTAQRPEFMMALELCKKEKAPLIVYSTCRFARDTIDQLVIEKELRESGSKLISLTDTVETETALGELIFTVQAALNRMERRRISERTKAAMQYMKAQGKRVGSIPHGYELADGNMLVPEADGQEMLKIVNKLNKKGLSLRKISEALAKKGVFNKNKRPFAAQSIKRMLAA